MTGGKVSVLWCDFNKKAKGASIFGVMLIEAPFASIAG
jgi:hypothetical protein